MIRIYELFQTKEAAHEFMKETFGRYHPAGYGTTLSYHKTRDGLHAIAGSRFASCD